MKTMTYADAAKKLEELFDICNDHFFANTLERPVLTILADDCSAYGWCSTGKRWKSGESEFHEINISAEYLNRPIAETIGTLVHEMVHLDNIYKGVQDCSSNGRYHNKKFKAAAEAHGLTVTKLNGYGFARTALDEESLAWVKEQGFETIDLVRVRRSASRGTSAGTTTGGESGEEAATPARSKYKYYQCPCCGVRFYTVAEINASCNDCGMPFIRYK